MLCQPTLALDEGFLNQLHCYKKILLGDGRGCEEHPSKIPVCLKFQNVTLFGNWVCVSLLGLPKTVCRSMGSFNNRMYFLTVLNVQDQGLVSPEPLPGLSTVTFLLYPHVPFLWCWFVTDIS